MDLALAGAILWKTGQMDFSHYNNSSLYFYGETDLNGNIWTPEDWKSLPIEDKTLIIGSLKEKNYKRTVYSVSNLKELFAGQIIPAENWKDRLKVPDIPELSFPQTAAELLKISAAGEHSLLLCGSAGSGKSTMAENLYYLLSEPSKKIF